MHRHVRTDEVNNAETKFLETTDKESHDRATFVKLLILLGIPAMMILLGLAGLYITRNIAKPIQEMAKISEYMAAGDLAFNFTARDRTDEVGVLEETFAKVINYQREMAGVANQLAVGDLSAAVKPRSDKDLLGQAFDRAIQYQREMSDLAHQIALGNLAVSVNPRSDKDILGQSMKTMVSNMRQHLEQITEGISALAAAASEITATSSQIASGAAQTATAVTETTATIEELRQTIHLSSQKAREVSENSQLTAQVSLDGKKAVDSTIDGMTRIRQQMDSIAESIVKLSEQSQAIGTIIAAVNDMADQSNLLAVNASIEAAKAGEQGKGFAVVAQEVRNLAEQSKQATSQVRSILNDIQKAISSAVMATEQGGKVVEIGVKQSSEAGGSIRTLSDSVSSSAQASVQIVAATNEQLVGMDQVAQAMESIKQASDQNVFGVRQVETAIHNLSSLGQNLKQMVVHYQV
jgi:methyl-accepting chemotaxis protein